MERTQISPAPTDAEAAAIVAAVDALWPRPLLVLHQSPKRETAWKFSGRWWTKPLPTRRARPFV